MRDAYLKYGEKQSEVTRHKSADAGKSRRRAPVARERERERDREAPRNGLANPPDTAVVEKSRRQAAGGEDAPSAGRVFGTRIGMIQPAERRSAASSEDIPPKSSRRPLPPSNETARSERRLPFPH
jgi:hypothetical protein